MAARRPPWWEHRRPTAWPWLPLSCLFFLLSGLRRLLYRARILRAERLPVPVIVVGNIAAGGSGKTPAVLWLVEALRQRGYTPGILSRGYGGRAAGPQLVMPDASPDTVGDEPLLLARRSGVPVCIGRDRVAAGRTLLAAHPDVNVIVTDDGLQHYRLARDVEIAVVDPHILGNRWLLPAGPMREGMERLDDVHVILMHGEGRVAAVRPCFRMRLEPQRWYRLANPEKTVGADELAGRRTVALAGIGHPQRFFDTVGAQGITPLETRAFPDHHPFAAGDLALQGADALLMTEKDAIKCGALAPWETWVLPVRACIDDAALDLVLERLHGPQAA